MGTQRGNRPTSYGIQIVRVDQELVIEMGECLSA